MELVRTRITSGIFWSVLMRWSLKLIGLLSTVILARLLTPEDFGLVAIATLVIGFIAEFATVNIALLLIRQKGSDRRHSDTAWTFGVMQGLVMAALLFVLAPFAADFFGDQRVVSVIHVLALMKVLSGFRNIGVILARKELDFAFDYRYMLYTRLATFFCVLIIALLQRDYWAIVYGTLGGEVIAVWLSYRMHPYRPRLCWTHAGEYFRFAIPMIPMAIAKLLNDKFDVVMVGSNAGTARMGVYNIANELGSIFTREVILPTTRGLFPNFARLAQDRASFTTVYLLIVSAAFAFCIPVAVGVWLTVDDLVKVVLGIKWLESAEYLKWLVIFGATSSVIVIMAEHPLIALKMEHMANRLMWLRLSVLVSCVLMGYQLAGILGIAIGMACSAVLNMPLVSLVVSRLLRIPLVDLWKGSISPALSAIAMCLFLVFLVRPLLSDANSLVSLPLMAGAGLVCYAATLCLLWWMRGRPYGIETVVLNKLALIIKNYGRT